MPVDSRPEQPDRELLDEARSDLEKRLGGDFDGATWTVGQRMDRKRSTLFPMALVSPDGDTVATAFYKAALHPEDTSRHLARARDAISRAGKLGDRFAELAADSDIAVNVTLAARAETLETVTLGLEGPPMGSPLRLLPTPARRQDAAIACYRVGKAARILEEMEPVDVDEGDQELRDSMERKLHSATSFLSNEETDRLRHLMDDLLLEAVENDGTVLAHGDLSPGNVILMGDQTGIIDFMWTTRVRGFDLSRFVHRLRHTTATFEPWTDALVTAAVEGYGRPSATQAPGWRISELMHLLTTLRRLQRRKRLRSRAGRRALAELRQSIGR